MKEIMKRNSEIAAYISSLGSDTPGEEQQSFLLKVGGGIQSVDASTNSECTNKSIDCVGSKNTYICSNYDGNCTDSSNENKCESVSSQITNKCTNVNVKLGCSCR